ncbi:hypothetical protein Tco_1253415 [Tanacetum coccineum]
MHRLLHHRMRLEHKILFMRPVMLIIHYETIINADKENTCGTMQEHRIDADKPNLSNHFTYANLFNYDCVKTKVNFRSIEFGVGNVEADLIIPMASVQEVSDTFSNSLYGYFIGKRIAYPLVKQYVWNKWSNNPIMLDSYTSSMCMDSWGHGSFARGLIEMDATCRIKDKLVVAISKLEGIGYTMETICVEYEWEPPRCDECSGFNKSTNGSYKPVVKPKSSTPVLNPFSALEEDNDNSIDDMVDDTRKKVIHYFDGDDMQFDDMGLVDEEVEHGNVLARMDYGFLRLLTLL